MSLSIPKIFDMWHFADAGKSLSGDLSMSEMSRLSSLVDDVTGLVNFELNFSRNRKKQATVIGFVSTRLKVECQRCLGIVDIPVNQTVNIIVVTGADEASLLADDVDPLVIESPLVTLSDLLEDELLLSLPTFPMHPENQCQLAYADDVLPQENDQETQPDNPFQALSGLKTSS